MKIPISSALSTDTSDEPCFKSEKVKFWAFGHRHYNCDFELSGVKVPRLYGCLPINVDTTSLRLKALM